MRFQQLAGDSLRARGIVFCIVGNLGIAYDGRQLYVRLLFGDTGKVRQSYEDFQAKRNAWRADDRKKPAVRKRFKAWRKEYDRKRREAQKAAAAT